MSGREKLVKALRAQSSAVYESSGDLQTSELLKTLAILVQGKGIYRAFGAPGDWGYGTAIGNALAEMYRDPEERDKL